jgi:hypothetical protein
LRHGLSTNDTTWCVVSEGYLLETCTVWKWDYTAQCCRRLFYWDLCCLQMRPHGVMFQKVVLLRLVLSTNQTTRRDVSEGCLFEICTIYKWEYTARCFRRLSYWDLYCLKNEVRVTQNLELPKMHHAIYLAVNLFTSNWKSKVSKWWQNWR